MKTLLFIAALSATTAFGDIFTNYLSPYPVCYRDGSYLTNEWRNPKLPADYGGQIWIGTNCFVVKRTYQTNVDETVSLVLKKQP